MREARDGRVVIPGYRITDELGRGAHGVVYRATQLTLERQVALKVAQGDALRLDPEMAQRFEREVALAAALAHRGIARVYDAGVVDGTLFYAMELVQGVDLGRLRERDGPLPPALVGDILDQLLAAVAYLHEQGMVHRDVKPANVILEDGSGRVVLLDLGLARMVESTLCTAPGVVMGTPRYMAPEQIMGEACTPASDLWSVGVTAYALLAPAPAFAAQDLTELLRTIVNTSPEPLERVRPDAPRELRDRIERLIVADPAARSAGVSTAARPRARANGPTVQRATARARAPGTPTASALVPFVLAAILGLVAVGLRFQGRAPRAVGSAPEASRAAGDHHPLPAPSGSTAIDSLVELERALAGPAFRGDPAGAVWKQLRARLGSAGGYRAGSLRRHAIAHPELAPAVQETLGGSTASLRPRFEELARDLASRMDHPDARLLGVLWKLDGVDAVARFLGASPPFDVRRRIAPWVEITGATTAPADARVGTRLHPTKAAPGGHLIYVANEDPGRGGELIKEVSEAAMEFSEPIFRGTAKSSFYELPRFEPGPGGFRLSLLVSSLPESSKLVLTGDLDLGISLPPSVDTGGRLDVPVWITLKVRGRLAHSRSRLGLRHERVFDESPRSYVMLREAWVLAMDGPP